MRANRRKVALCCEDPLLQDYLRRVLEQCPTLEVVCSPPPAEPLDAVIISHNCLTPTEIEVLQKVADKGSVRRAAQALCRSETTLKRELAAIREKLGVRTTLQAVVWALRQGVIR
jgi:DNA-binding CsgD family transcriptional regulator